MDCGRSSQVDRRVQPIRRRDATPLPSTYLTGATLPVVAACSLRDAPRPAYLCPGWTLTLPPPADATGELSAAFGIGAAAPLRDAIFSAALLALGATWRGVRRPGSAIQAQGDEESAAYHATKCLAAGVDRAAECVEVFAVHSTHQLSDGSACGDTSIVPASRSTFTHDVTAGLVALSGDIVRRGPPTGIRRNTESGFDALSVLLQRLAEAISPMLVALSKASASRLTTAQGRGDRGLNG